VFNLALAFHLSAMACSDLSLRVQYLQKASILYGHANNLQLNVGDIARTNLFYMATLNNLGQVHRSLGDDEKARYYVAQLLSALLFLQQRASDKMKKYRGYIWCFFQTASFLHSPSDMSKITGAAAA
jgi:hypothetical protein